MLYFDSFSQLAELDKMMLGQSRKLESQFRLTYTMILNLMRVEALKVEEMIKRSFSENSSQRMLPEHRKIYAEKVKSLGSMKALDCSICSSDIRSYHATYSMMEDARREMYADISKTPTGSKALSPGRLIVIHTVCFFSCFFSFNADPVKLLQSSIEKFFDQLMAGTAMKH